MTNKLMSATLVTLDGSGSDPDNRGDVTFRWKQVFSPPSLVLSEDPVDLSDETDPSPTFTFLSRQATSSSSSPLRMLTA